MWICDVRFTPKSGHSPGAITNIREATKADARVAELVIQYRHGESLYWDSASPFGGTVMALRSDHHSDFEGAQLALLGMAGIVLCSSWGLTSTNAPRYQKLR